MAGDDIRATVARQTHTFFERSRRSRRLDDDIGAQAAGQVEDVREPLLRGRVVDVDDVVRAHVPRQRQAIRRRADHDHLRGADRRASAAALRPTAPAPCTTTVSPSESRARSMMWTDVNRPHPPPM
jgi:hypothetical protein